MTTTTLLDRCAAVGISLSVDSGVLRVDAPEAPEVDTLVRELKANKARVLCALQARDDTPAVDRPKLGDQLVTLLRSFASKGEYALSEVPALLRTVIDQGIWRERTIEQTGEVARFDRLEDFITTPALAGLGTTSNLLRRLCDAAQDADVLTALNGDAEALPPSHNSHYSQKHTRPSDPRAADYPEDSRAWVRLLWLADLEDDAADAGGCFAPLHFVRTPGAALVREDAGYRIKPQYSPKQTITDDEGTRLPLAGDTGWSTPEEWERTRTAALLPPQGRHSAAAAPAGGRGRPRTCAEGAVMLTTNEHQAVQHAKKANRNAAAKARRATLGERLREVAIVPAQLPDNGEPLRFAIARAEPNKAHVLRLDRKTNTWRCLCFGRVYGNAPCAHELAAAQQEAVSDA